MLSYEYQAILCATFLFKLIEKYHLENILTIKLRSTKIANYNNKNNTKILLKILIDLSSFLYNIICYNVS